MLLNGWKEIAAYLRSGVRTVQRWERAGLPVIRPSGGGRGPVVAYTDDLDRWMKGSNNAQTQILKIQTEIAHSKQLRMSLAKERLELRRHMDELRRELASLRTKRRRH